MFCRILSLNIFEVILYLSFLFLFVWFFLHIRAFMGASSRELDLQGVVSLLVCLLGTELKSSGILVEVYNPWTIFLSFLIQFLRKLKRARKMFWQVGAFGFLIEDLGLVSEPTWLSIASVTPVSEVCHTLASTGNMHTIVTYTWM